MTDVRMLDRPDDVAERAAQDAVTTLGRAIEEHGSATWALAGGSSPMQAYRTLVGQHAGALDWSKVTVLIGDERLVPLDHADSNWGQIVPLLTKDPAMASLRQLSPHPELGLDGAADDYERQVRSLPADDHGLPRLDLVWLGVGEDGHTLSLFPGFTTLDETERLVAAVSDAPKPPPRRLTLTLPALDGARRVVIFAVGSAKKDVLARAIAGADLPIGRAAERAESTGAEVTWLFDAAASPAARG